MFLFAKINFLFAILTIAGFIGNQVIFKKNIFIKFNDTNQNIILGGKVNSAVTSIPSKFIKSFLFAFECIIAIDIIFYQNF